MKKKKIIKVIQEKRADACREGAQRYTMIIEKHYVNCLKSYSAEHKITISSIVNEALGIWFRAKQR